jgi:ATP-dependent RNA helicase DDX5/DBP2
LLELGYGSGDFGQLPQQSWEASTMIQVVKDFYVEHPDVTAMSDAEVAEFRKSISVEVEGRDVPKPIRTFEEGRYLTTTTTTTILLLLVIIVMIVG